MGSIRKQRKKFLKPPHPWEKERIEEEKVLIREYALKNKKGIWKLDSVRKKFAQQAKKLIADSSAQGEVEKKQLLTATSSLGLIEKGAGVGAVLTITLRDILDRTLQTRVYKQNLARSMKQARQFITHGHILIKDKKVTIPSYLVSSEEENNITFNPTSALMDTAHPERAPVEEKPSEEKKKKPADKKGKKKEEKRPAEKKKKPVEKKKPEEKSEEKKEKKKTEEKKEEAKKPEKESKE